MGPKAAAEAALEKAAAEQVRQLALHLLYLGIADGMPIARVWAHRYSK